MDVLTKPNIKDHLAWTTCLWTFWTRPNVKDHLAWTKCLCGYFGQDQMSANPSSLLYKTVLSFLITCFSDLWIQKLSDVHCLQITPGYLMTSHTQRTRYSYAAQLLSHFPTELHTGFRLWILLLDPKVKAQWLKESDTRHSSITV